MREFTVAQRRAIVLQAADQIESTPHRYLFSSICIPPPRSCGTPACALGWIAHFAHFTGAEREELTQLGMNAFSCGTAVLFPMASRSNLGTDTFTYLFYQQMDLVLGSDRWRSQPWRSPSYSVAERRSKTPADLAAVADDTVKGLRLYAAKYFPVPTVSEQSVRAEVADILENLAREEVTC